MNLAEYPALDWRGRQVVLLAQTERESLMLYTADLIWLIAKTKYRDLPQPSTLMDMKARKKDTRTGKQIIDDLLKNLS